MAQLLSWPAAEQGLISGFWGLILMGAVAKKKEKRSCSTYIYVRVKNPRWQIIMEPSTTVS